MQLRWIVIAIVLAALVPVAGADEQADTLKSFKQACKAKDWRERRSAYRTMAKCDSEACAEAVLAAATKERNAAVVLEGIKTLGSLKSEEARSALVGALAKAKGNRSTILLMALARQKGSAGTGALSEILRGKDAQRAALAALALGAKAQEYSLADLVAALDHPDWQVVSAAARGIKTMALVGKPRNTASTPALPTWFATKEILQRLADRLEAADGVERGDLIDALETISGKQYGWNVGAWQAVAVGKVPDRAMLRGRRYPPHMFGIPIYGRSVSIVFDANVHIDNAHPYKKRERLVALSQVPGGREISWFKINTIEEFSRAHVVRGIRDLPDDKHKFELFFSALKPERVFGKLVAANPGNKERAVASFEKLKYSNGNDVLEAMNRALDVSGKKDSVAWQKGPDTVLCVYSSDPALAKETDQEVIGAAIGLKAAGRMVRIEAVGVYHHAGMMLKLFGELSGGRYLTLER